MATINIDRRINDDHCRYTMPRIQIKTQGSTTILTNLDVIARKLDRSPIHILKFFAYKFSTKVIVDESKNLFAFGGIRDRDELQNLLYTFIDHFVICSQCANPETKLILRKQKTNEIFKKCLACGAVTPSEMQADKTIKFIAKALLEEEDSLVKHSLLPLLQDKSKLNDEDTIQQIMDILILTDNSLTLIVKNIFTENVRQEIVDYKNLFQQLCRNNRRAQLDLLSGFEMIINDQKITQAKIIEEILFNLYNEDIIDEDTFHFWYRNCLTEKSIRKLVNGFIQWLNNAD